MLKREITFKDFNDVQHTETFYFNISQPELIEMEVEQEGGLSAWIQEIIKTENAKELVAHFKKLVLLSYGIKSEDGRRFVKSDQLREEFSQTNAYSTLFMELATNDESAAAFIKGIMPADLEKQVDDALASNTPPLPPAA